MTNDTTSRTNRPITRRRLVTASGAALAVGLAGCTEIGLSGEGGDGEQEGGGGEQEGGEDGEGGGGQEGGDGQGGGEQEGSGGDQEGGGEGG